MKGEGAEGEKGARREREGEERPGEREGKEGEERKGRGEEAKLA